LLNFKAVLLANVSSINDSIAAKTIPHKLSLSRTINDKTKRLLSWARTASKKF